jgi:REP element-mobilizing transposase RayT
MFGGVLREYRQEKSFLLIGWVLMPEHFHLLINPEPAESTSRPMQELKRVAQSCFLGLRLATKWLPASAA